MHYTDKLRHALHGESHRWMNCPVGCETDAVVIFINPAGTPFDGNPNKEAYETVKEFLSLMQKHAPPKPPPPLDYQI